jgi:hypothetical protein
VDRLTNRLRLSWLTVAALVAFTMVAALAPEGGGVARLTFAHTADQFRALLLRTGEMVVSIQTVNMLRAQLAADMVLLVAYGLLMRMSVRVLASVPFAGPAAHAAVLTMAADAAENIFALAILRTIGDENRTAAAWWFVGMNAAAALKWALAGTVMLCLGIGWRRETPARQRWRRWTARVIAAAFALGGLASLVVVAGLVIALPQWIAGVALLAPAAAFLLQFRLLDTSALMIRFLYLARVPFLVLVVMAAFGPIALGPAVDLLGGILVATSLIGVAVTTAAAGALLFACVTQINIVRAYASQRVLDDSLRVLDHEVLSTCVFWSGIVAAGSLLFSVGVASPGRFLLGWQIVGGLALGAAGALVIQFIIEWIAARLADVPDGYPSPEFSLPFRRVPLLADLLAKAKRRPQPGWKRQFVGWFFSRLFGLSSGYVELLPNGSRRILPGHSYATVQFLLTMLVFWAALELKARPMAAAFYRISAAQTEAEFLVPTVTSVVLLLLLLSWALGAVAFFVDRYRTPLFTIAVGLAFITGARACTDYTLTVPGGSGSYELATPGEVLKAFGSQPFVVAAAGGGIQAGAWTARVLQGLDDHLSGTFRRRVAAISAVSGGSMGVLYYGAYLREPTLEGATQQALKPSLDDVATSLVSRDVFGVIGLRSKRDRGSALEASWEQRLPEAARSDATLRAWSDRTREFARGQTVEAFPAFLFNSTIVESGQPIAFATTQLPTRAYRGRFDLGARQHPVVESANRILRLSATDGAPARDVGLKTVTAARLSAAFPYVSPAIAFDLQNAEPFHLVDGGYYDVYGLVALSQWLDDALEEIARTSTPPSTIGVVIARGLASSDSALLTRLRNDDPTTPTLDATIERKGWRWQLTAPPSTALNARTFAQWAGSVQVLRLLIDKWSERDVRIEPYVFDYPGGDRTPVCQSAPLSWKLTAPQQDCIESAWKTFLTDPSSALSKVK